MTLDQSNGTRTRDDTLNGTDTIGTMCPGTCHCFWPMCTFLHNILEVSRVTSRNTEMPHSPSIDPIPSPCPIPGPVPVQCEFTIRGSCQFHILYSALASPESIHFTKPRVTVNSFVVNTGIKYCQGISI